MFGYNTLMLKPIEKTFIEDIFGFFLFIEKPNIPKRIVAEAEQRGLFEKPEYHVSVVVEKTAVCILEALKNMSDGQDVRKKIVDLFDEFDFKYDLTDTYSLQEKTYSREELDLRGLVDEPVHTRRSIIQMVHMPDIDLFFKEISRLLNIKMDVPIPHVTIFAWSDYDKKKNRGIGISSQKDFETFNQGFI